MDHHILIGLGLVIVIGVAANWLAWRLRLPSILVLLLAGFIAGPVTGILHPDDLLGDLLSPLISYSVALILFEGGLSLKLSELRQIRGVLRRLVTTGALITWVMVAASANLFLGLDLSLSILLGAVLIVTGPTVIIPLLRDIRPTGQVKSILRWEGILIDPIGVTLAVLVFEGIAIADVTQATAQLVIGFATMLLVGILLGAGIGLLLTAALRRYWIPDHLQIPMVLMAVIGAYALSDLIQTESGLMTVTIMGIVMANQKSTSVKHITSFKENIGVLLLSSLFVLLAARLHINDLAHLSVQTILFVAFVILVVRPVVTLVSTFRSDLTWKERLFIAWMAPRGIVAAATASLFALELSNIGHPQAELLTPITFTIIVFTVTIYGLTAGPLARRLGLSQDNPQGVLIVGAQSWALEIAAAIQALGHRVLLVDSNRENIQAARLQGFETHYGNVLTDDLEELDLEGIGKLIALTSNDEVNALASLHFSEVFGRANVYQLSCQPAVRSEAIPMDLRGRILFEPNVTYHDLNHLFGSGAKVKTTALTNEFTPDDFVAMNKQSSLPLFVVQEDGNLQVIANDQPVRPQVGQSIISIAVNGDSLAGQADDRVHPAVATLR